MLDPADIDRNAQRFFEQAATIVDRDRTEVLCLEGDGVLMVRRWTDAPGGGDHAVLVASFAREPRPIALPPGEWRLAIDTTDPRWSGADGAPRPDGLAGRVIVAPRSRSSGPRWKRRPNKKSPPEAGL